ncbi:uncharacterized protein LOC106653957 [Trichogramma pretiosum]|uniref:uncharacterized protein LOC106653957 n=1 Tax=Trichogramma pretiosum TaxID=7493 RepID=UPI0006C98CDE|nr:uncharacterized protein LOC106653957 [Trichogramma pretiosum]
MEGSNGQSTFMKSDPIAYPVKEDIKDPAKTIVQHQVAGNEVKMLVILKSGEQRLITFTLANHECTVADLLEQANIQDSAQPCISLVSDPNLHYIVNFTVPSSNNKNEDKQLFDESRNQVNDGKTASSTGLPDSTSSITELAKPAKKKVYVNGFLAVCSYCGMNSPDFNYCIRCKRKIPDKVKAMSISTGVITKLDNPCLNLPLLAQKEDSALLQGAEMV